MGKPGTIGTRECLKRKYIILIFPTDPSHHHRNQAKSHSDTLPLHEFMRLEEGKLEQWDFTLYVSRSRLVSIKYLHGRKSPRTEGNTHYKHYSPWWRVPHTSRKLAVSWGQFSSSTKKMRGGKGWYMLKAKLVPHRRCFPCRNGASLSRQDLAKMYHAWFTHVSPTWTCLCLHKNPLPFFLAMKSYLLQLLAS